MVLLDELVSWAPGEATCRMRLPESAPFAREGRVHAVACIEYMGQAVAACLGNEAFQSGEGVRVGMIIGCRSMTLHRTWIPEGTDLTVSVRRVRGNDTLSHFDCVVSAADPVAEAVLTLYHASKPPEE